MFLGFVASLRADATPGTDNITAGMLKVLPIEVLYYLYLLFLLKLKGIHIDSPDSWRFLRMRGIPKEVQARTLQQWRWLTVTSTVQKLFAKCALWLLEPQLREVRVQSLGFRAEVGTTFVHSTLRIILAKAAAFKLPLMLTNADVQTAFASITITELAVALSEMGACSTLQYALLDELMRLKAQASVADAPASCVFNFTKGGREGGSDTPLLWRVLLDWLLSPVIENWIEQKVGFRLVEHGRALEETPVHSHMVWADNLFFFVPLAA